MLKRSFNIDFFRIIATLMVIVLHILEQGGILNNAKPNGTFFWSAWFLEICTFCAVNCFALITGYLMVDKTTKTKNILTLWFQVLFYSLLLTALFFIFLPESRTIKNLILSFLPIVGNRWWYISSYFAVFFFIPFLNEGIKHISQQTHKKLLFILLGISSIGCIIPIDAFRLNKGYSAIWLIIVYLFGAYIKKYNLSQKFTALKSILIFFSMILITFLSKLIFNLIGIARLEYMFISYTSIPMLLSAIFLFLFCLNVKINNTMTKLISFVAPGCLGVYLIHVHPLVFDFSFHFLDFIFSIFSRQQLFF